MSEADYPNYHTTKVFTEKVLAVEMKKTNKQKRNKTKKTVILLDNSLYLGLLILALSKILMYEF